MRSHPYAIRLDKSPTYYLDWAVKEWEWFKNSGMINSDYLINGRLRGPPLSEAEIFFSCLFWFSFVNVYDGVLYPRYKNQNYTSLDSSGKSKIFEGYDPKKKFPVGRKIVSVSVVYWCFLAV